MSASVAIPSTTKPSLKPSNFTSQTLLLGTSICSLKPKDSFLGLYLSFGPKIIQSAEKLELSASAANSIPSKEGTPSVKEKLGVVVKPMEKPRIVLKLVWMQKSIGLALDHIIPGFGTIPLSPYYFWPKEDAWEQLKLLLESKPWISRKQMDILLNQATDIINLWQENGCSS